jgi:hypothetical protein
MTMNKNAVSGTPGTEESNDRKASRGSAESTDARLAKIKRAGLGVTEGIGAYVKEQPVAAVGIALGAGFVLGSILGNRLGRVALTAAVGYAAQELIEGVLGAGGVRKLVVDEVSKLAVARSDKTAS